MVEIGDTRLRELTHFFVSEQVPVILCRNRRYPFKGIDTTPDLFLNISAYWCRNRRYPFKGIDTTPDLFLNISAYWCRNRRYPFKGIDTHLITSVIILVMYVEIGDTRLRELTQLLIFF